jgi:hypothetical protein
MILALFAVFFCISALAFAMVAEESIVGEVVNSGSGYAIAIGDGAWYLVEGCDVSGLLGQTVKATGTITEQSGVRTISVTAIEKN